MRHRPSVPAPLLALLLAALIALPGIPAAARAQIAAPEYAARRAALAARLPDGAILLALGAREPEQDYVTFFQASPFRYLTGFLEPDAALVMVKQRAKLTSMLFVQPRDPRREVWTGRRLGAAGVTARTGMRGREIDELRPTLDSLIATGLPFYVVGDLAGGSDLDAPGDAATPDAQLVQALERAHPGLRVTDATRLVDELRGHKSAAEQALIRRAVDITAEAQREAMKVVAPGRNEYEVQAAIEYTFRRNGAERPSFSTIVGSGPNSTTLHYNTDDRVMRAGETVVMDIGASYDGYAADVTRTLPVSGTFTPEQREVYTLVRAAQAAAEHEATLGAAAVRMEIAADSVLAGGLARLGLIESAAATYDCSPDGKRQCPQFRLYYMHGIGHGIGLDVHDPDQYYFQPGTIAPGSAFTIEPGIYVRADVLDWLPDTPRNRALKSKLAAAVARYANIGIRIEDDYLATDRGVEWISRAPRELEEVEASMRTTATGGMPRGAR